MNIYLICCEGMHFARMEKACEAIKITSLIGLEGRCYHGNTHNGVADNSCLRGSK